jgi:hypothetical protein
MFPGLMGHDEQIKFNFMLKSPIPSGNNGKTYTAQLFKVLWEKVKSELNSILIKVDPNMI